MGGKHKGQAQRTKNNTKASTSGRSAELLNSSINVLPSFSNVVREDFSSLVMDKTNLNENDAAINSDIQLAIKKMGKKDSTTKLKALQEFTTLIDKSDISEVTPVLPIWSKIYPTLSMDTEHRVREATQVSHGAVVTKCGRTLAPYLKQLAPAWLMSQYDTFPPAATQAQSSLQNVFPSAKLPDVISFCRVELLSSISKNVLLQTPAMITNAKSCTPEDSEAIYQRMLIASLQGYALITRHLPAEHIVWFCQEQEAILNNIKFWKLASHKNPQIRSAWYVTIGCLCEKQSNWFGEKYASKTLNILVKNLNEEDSTVAPKIWDCLLMLMSIKETWSKNTVIDKVITDQLCSIAANGGHGSATKLAPILLPLLAHLPESLRTLQFYNRFFEDVVKGMDQRSILSSKIEGNAWVSGLAECLRFVSMENQATFVSQLVPAVVRSWLQKAIHLRKTQCSHHLFRHSVGSIATLARFWTKQSLDSSLHYTQLIRLFWQNMRFIFTSEMDRLEASDDEIKAITEIHIELIFGLKNNALLEKKIVKVKFGAESDISSDVKENVVIWDDSTNKINDVYDRDLLIFASEVASVYLKYAISKNIAAPILIPLCSVLAEFDQVDMFNAIFHAVFPESSAVQLIKLYTDLWHKWLTGDAMRCKSVVDLIFMYLKYLTNEEQTVIFKGFNQFTPSVVEMCIAKCLCYPFSCNPKVKEWLNSDVVSDSLMVTCKQLIQNGDKKKAALLKMCFAEDSDGEIIIGSKSCAAIIYTISEFLPTIRSKHLDMCASFASHLASVSIKVSSVNIKLILSMIQLNVSIKAGNELLSKETWWEVNIAWQDAIQSSKWEDSEITRLVTGAEKIIKQSLQIENQADIDMEQIEVVTAISADLIMSLVSTIQPHKREKALCDQFEMITGANDAAKAKQWLNIYYHSIVFDIMRDHLNVPFAGKDKTLETVLKNVNNVFNEDLDSDTFKNDLVQCLFSTKLMHRILMPTINKTRTSDCSEEEDECYEPDKILWTTDFDMFEVMHKYAMLLLHNIMILESLFHTHQCWQYYQIMSSVYPKLEILQIEIIDNIASKDNSKKIALDYLQNKADIQGMYWSKALCFYKKCIKEPIHPRYEKIKDEECNLPNTQSQEKILDALAPKCMDTFEGTGFFHNLMASVNIDPDNIDPIIIEGTAGMVAIRCILLSTDLKKNMMNKDHMYECFKIPFGCLAIIIKKYYEDKSIMLYEQNISDVNWISVQTNVSILRYLTRAVKYYGWHLNDVQWDFITLSLTLVLKSLLLSMSGWRTLKWSSLCCAVFGLYNEVKTFIYSIPSRCKKSAPSEAVGNLPSEWKDVFEPNIHEYIINIVLHIFDEYTRITDLKLTTKEAFVISHIGRYIDENTFRHKDDGTSLDDLIKSSLSVLSSTRHHSLKYTAYKIMKTLVGSLVTHDSNVLNSLSEGCEEGASLPKMALHKIETTLVHIQELLEVILSPFIICEDSCSFKPFTDSFGIALSYLLIWNVINKITSSATGDLTHQYAEFLKSGKYVEHLCSNTFKMLPSAVIHRKEMASVDTQLQVNFNSFVKIKYDKPITPDLISAAACFVLSETMSGIGASSVRDWLILQDSERGIDSIVSTFISPHLNYNAMQDVQVKSAELKDVQVRIHWTTNELTAVHTVEGKDFELSIKLAPNNPLTKPKVTCTGVAAIHTNWLTLFLSYQHGSLWEAVNMWVGSLQKKIQGSAVCYICYCRLQPTTGQLTKFVCYTCKNKFHTTCLYKWFRHGSKNTCPLCRKHF